MRWSKGLIPGRMPLWLAWIAAAVLVIAFWTLVETSLDAVPRGLSDGLQLASAVVAMPIAHMRGRRWWLWGLLAGAPIALLFATRLYSPLLQPMFGAVAVLLAARPSPSAATIEETPPPQLDAPIQASAEALPDPAPDPTPDRPSYRRRRRY